MTPQDRDPEKRHDILVTLRAERDHLKKENVALKDTITRQAVELRVLRDARETATRASVAALSPWRRR